MMTSFLTYHRRGTTLTHQRSELACPVCCHHTLSEQCPYEPTEPNTDRLFCHFCGAHRLLEAE